MSVERFDIVVRGELAPMIVEEFVGFEVVPGHPGSTRLLGTVPDQARLVGLLDLLRGFDVEIESVTHVPGRDD
ncbi:hypothetical protein GCM10017608_06680 [Agromyces luteolus]|uniref:DUF4911 domain-containing protein n=1 Tax=Agromyces luteolus TaxID=88373 RepID=A0A7C9LG42_9MICO|nr:hypothetical protein [Agromyces luteolus]MUN06234.1 hypothetical protein [Agromyces luteolus]GLK26736.1 hypothetical protein GCM10017608_06680 [Agromyces luteolus]